MQEILIELRIALTYACRLHAAVIIVLSYTILCTPDVLQQLSIEALDRSLQVRWECVINLYTQAHGNHIEC